jgi:hypothetical protein
MRAGTLSARSTSAIQLAGDRVNDSLDFLEDLLEVLARRALAVFFEPVRGLLDGREDRLLVLVRDLAAETFLVAELRLESPDLKGVVSEALVRGEEVGTYEVLESVEGLDALALSLVLGRKLLSLTDHAVNLLLAETSLLVGDGDRLRLATIETIR